MGNYKSDGVANPDPHSKFESAMKLITPTDNDGLRCIANINVSLTTLYHRIHQLTTFRMFLLLFLISLDGRSCFQSEAKVQRKELEKEVSYLGVFIYRAKCRGCKTWTC